MTAIPNQTGAAARSPMFRTFIWLSLALLAISVFGLTDNPTYDLIGRGVFYSVALSFIPATLYFMVVQLEIPAISSGIVKMFVALLALNVVHVLTGLNAVALTFMVQYSVIICAFMLFMQAGAAREDTGFRIVALMCVGILGIYALQALNDRSLAFGEGWAGGLSNQNLFGMFVFMLLCMATVLLNLSRRQQFGLVVALVAMSFILIYASKSRSSLIALVVFCGTYFAWPFLARRRWGSVFYFVGVLAVIWYMIYSGAERVGLASIIDQVLSNLSREYGKNVDSGRSIIWNYALDVISDKPVFGWGTSLATTSILNTGLSFHNWYLTILYHFGLVGLTAYLILLFLIWRTFCLFGHHPYARLAGSALIGMMMTQVYEVSLTQNNLNIGVVYWSLFGLVIGRIAADEKVNAFHPGPALAEGLARPLHRLTPISR